MILWRQCGHELRQRLYLHSSAASRRLDGLYERRLSYNRLRRFPPPWTVEPGGFKVVDANGQTLAFVYGHADPREAALAKGLSLDEARRIASNIAKLPTLLTEASASTSEKHLP
jgi:hypothetical protein